MINFTHSQGESPAISQMWNGADKIARITGVHGKSKFTVHMECGITLVNKYDTKQEALKAAAQFYFDNFYLDIIEKAGI